MVDGVIRRKVLAARGDMAEGGPGADRGWRLALARAARDQLKAPLEVTGLTQLRAGLAEVLEVPPERALVVVLEGPAEGLGMLALGPEVYQAMVEVLTIGRVATQGTAPRKATRTDAAMLAPMIDAALADLEAGLATEADLVWAGGWRYASYLDDPRPLGLMLEDFSYRVISAEVDIGAGARQGRVILALPAEGRGQKPRPVTAGVAREGAAAERRFTEALAETLGASHVRIEAVLTRISLPLARIMALGIGDELVLRDAALDRISLEGLDGRKMAEGRLGQNRGMRAVRLAAALAGGGTTNRGVPAEAVAASQPGAPASQTSPAGGTQAAPIAGTEPAAGLRQSA